MTKDKIEIRARYTVAGRLLLIGSFLKCKALLKLFVKLNPVVLEVYAVGSARKSTAVRVKECLTEN